MVSLLLILIILVKSISNIFPPPPPPGAVALVNSEFSESQLPSVLNSVVCGGSERHLLSCNHSTQITSPCGPSEDAGVVCQCKFNRVNFLQIVLLYALFVYLD